MAEQQRRFFDVWIVETNTVYREVPFTVVVDWIQQGRLLENDMLRPSGTAQWFKIGGMPTFAAYLPKAEPYRVEDQAEALEPVQVDFSWRRRHDDDDEEDVDMIPLIDVSLVLLIFFMMVGAGIVSAALVATPTATYGWQSSSRELWVGITADNDGNPTTYYLGQENEKKFEAKVAGQTADDAFRQFLGALDTQLEGMGRRAEVTILANGKLKSGVVRQVLVELEKRNIKVLERKKIGVSQAPS